MRFLSPKLSKKLKKYLQNKKNGIQFLKVVQKLLASQNNIFTCKATTYG